MSEEKDGMIQMALEGIHAGFPSPAQDYMSGVIDLNKELVRHRKPPSTAAWWEIR